VNTAVGLAILALSLTACGSGQDRTELTVLAASSLTEAFDQLEVTYEEQHPDVDVVLSYDSSATLAAQVLEDAPVDVLATADLPTMQTVVDAGLVQEEPAVFATNTLVIVTPADNPAGIDGIEDLADPDVLLAVCAPTAPCGDATGRLFELNGVAATPVTEEDHVKGVLTKVTAGEVDAGLVYASDAQAAGDAVSVVDTARAAEVVNVDPIAVVAATEHPAQAQAWVDLVLSADGQQVLSDLGFGPAS